MGVARGVPVDKLKHLLKKEEQASGALDLEGFLLKLIVNIFFLSKSDSQSFKAWDWLGGRSSL